MSEMEHFKGKLTPTGKTVDEFVDEAEIPSCYKSKREYFEEVLWDTAIEIDGNVHKITCQQYDDCDDIFESSKNEDGTIDFQVRYHNGGCCFSEALECALK